MSVAKTREAWQAGIDLIWPSTAQWYPQMHHEILEGWDHFEKRLREIAEDRLARQIVLGSSGFLYRGQPNSSWSLKTTLERYSTPSFTIERYYQLITAIQAQVETFTEQQWDQRELPNYPGGYKDWLEENQRIFPYNLPGYACMVYLRHHGFPSPLLDWSRSPYVAAFFAFNSAIAVDKISIYVYWERPDGIGFHSSAPSIYHMGPYVKAHPRHFLQQAEYTIGVEFDAEWKYTPHERAFGKDSVHPDALWKFDLPASERVRVLKLLDVYNLNEFSLFDSIESMLGTLALRELSFRDP